MRPPTTWFDFFLDVALVRSLPPRPPPCLRLVLRFSVISAGVTVCQEAGGLKCRAPHFHSECPVEQGTSEHQQQPRTGCRLREEHLYSSFIFSSPFVPSIRCSLCVKPCVGCRLESSNVRSHLKALPGRFHGPSGDDVTVMQGGWPLAP